MVEIDPEWQEFRSDQSADGKSHHLHLYFLPIEDLKEEDLSFPIDRHVLRMLKSF